MSFNDHLKNLIYWKSLTNALANKDCEKDDSVLVVCGGAHDQTILQELGFKNVTISNLDSRMKGNEFEPFKWSFQDAEKLNFSDDSFDWVIVHAGLHHCYSPHKALIEMLRVGKKGIFVFEARASLVMNFAAKIGLTPKYEIEAVIGNDLQFGGVANTNIPNHVYRWKEDEIIKITNSYYPAFENNKVNFYYNLRLPQGRIEFIKSPIKRRIMALSFIPMKILSFFFPKQRNEFGFNVIKGDLLQPWLQKGPEAIQLNLPYLKKHFNTTIRK